jgi:hypothetical protein
MQAIYPAPQRGRILAAVQVGQVACILILTPQPSETRLPMDGKLVLNLKA